jgi:tetratricopeptide (TPR) repeat protein
LNTTSQTIHSKPPVLYILLLFALGVLVYLKLFSANFISWDDGDVLLNNKDVHHFDVKAFFSRYYVGNYAPLTMLGFAIDWLLFHGNAAAHHAVNLVLHMVNGLLVYKLSHLLLKDKAKSILCTVIFCFHPLQVETVAWVSAKNNILYAQFFLLGLISYSNYCIEGIKKQYIWAFVFFVAALLSKPSAICFPLCIILLDYFLKDKPSLKSVLLNKIPFVIVSIILALVTIYTRTEDKFIKDNHAYAIHERIGYAGYALLQYLYKFLVPVNLSVIYPYPQNKTLSVVVGYVMILALGFLCYKGYKSGKKIIWFGLLFFIANLLLVLQLLPFGEVLTADRYMYLPILGLSWILASFVPLKEKQFNYLSLALMLVLGVLTFLRTTVWQNSIGLYTDIIKKYPHSFVALNSLGAEHMLNKNYDKSMGYLNSAIAENRDYYKGYYNRGLLYAQTNRMQEALADFTKAIGLKQYPKAYVARANVYYTLHDYAKAIEDAQTVLRTDPQNIKAVYVLATSYEDMNRLDLAMDQYNKLIYVANDNPLFLLRRAILHGKMQNFKACLNDLEVATSMDPNFAEAYYWKGVAKANLKENPCQDLKKAVDMGFRTALPALTNYCH